MKTVALFFSTCSLLYIPFSSSNPLPMTDQVKHIISVVEGNPITESIKAQSRQDSDTDLNSVDRPEIELPVPPPTKKKQSKKSDEDDDGELEYSWSIMKRMSLADDLIMSESDDESLSPRIRVPRSPLQKDPHFEQYGYQQPHRESVHTDSVHLGGLKPDPRQRLSRDVDGMHLIPEHVQTMKPYIRPGFYRRPRRDLEQQMKPSPKPYYKPGHFSQHGHHFNHHNQFHSPRHAIVYSS